MQIQENQPAVIGTDNRVFWKPLVWKQAAVYLMQRFPQFCNDPTLKGIMPQDVMDMQKAVLDPYLHRTKKGLYMVRVREKLWEQMVLIRAAAKDEPVPSPVALPVPSPVAIPMPSPVRELPPVQEEEPHDSQLRFFPPVREEEDHPAYKGEPVAAPLPESVKMGLALLSRPLTPGMALQELGSMNMNTLLDLIADKVADRVVAKMADSINLQVTQALGNSKAKEAVEKKHEEVKAEVKVPMPQTSKPEEKGTFKDQLKTILKQAPKLRKPKIVIIGMQPSQAREIDKEFSQFELVHINHANDKIKDKVENAHKVICVEQKVGGAGPMLRKMHGANFTLTKFSMTSIRHQLAIWETCYNEDPDYFKMNDTERNKANHQYANS